MNYATVADAELNGSLTKMARGYFGPGAISHQTEGRAPSEAARTAVRIFTLGRFSVAIYAHAIRSNGKAQHRPLVLLKALVALGGRDVACSRLCECLWPDSDGDLAGRNLNITVHRLRQLLHARDVVLQHNGKLTLNAQLCWVDVWDFERFANNGLERTGNAGLTESAESNLRAALALYSGHFLARESEEAWMLAPRLRLNTKFERLVTALSMHLEHQMRFAEAIDTCLQALGVDPLNELIYRRLMSCYLKRGELASVLGTYRRCREALAKGLSAPVSGETQRLYVEAVHAAEREKAQSDTITPGSVVHQFSAHAKLN
jgi:LuxR family maltose regulon positive regulatory protein